MDRWFEKDGLQLRDLNIEGYERVIEVRSADVDLHGFVAIHNTVLGPSLGGVRVREYEGREGALYDVLRLSKGMTLKAALSGTGTGGGKGVIVLKKGQRKTPEMLRAFAKAIEALEGEYIGAEDMNMSVADVGLLRENTRYLVGLEHPSSSGNPSVYTARGGYRGIQAALQILFGSPDVKGRRIAIQGLGATGMEMARFLFWEGADLIVSDLDTKKVEIACKELGAQAVSPQEILFVPCDVLSPCAIGGIFTHESIQNIQCQAIAGIANNQLLEESVGVALHQRGILYIPDFVINAGGLLNVSVELSELGYRPAVAREKVDRLFQVILDLIFAAKVEGIAPFQIAEKEVDRILKQANRAVRFKPTFHH